MLTDWNIGDIYLVNCFFASLDDIRSETVHVQTKILVQLTFFQTLPFPVGQILEKFVLNTVWSKVSLFNGTYGWTAYIHSRRIKILWIHLNCYRRVVF